MTDRVYPEGVKRKEENELRRIVKLMVFLVCLIGFI